MQWQFFLQNSLHQNGFLFFGNFKGVAQSRSWYHAPSVLYLNLPRRRRWLNISPPCMYSRTMYRLLLSWNHTGQNRNNWQNFYQHIYKSDPVRNTLRKANIFYMGSINLMSKTKIISAFSSTALGEKIRNPWFNNFILSGFDITAPEIISEDFQLIGLS